MDAFLSWVVSNVALAGLLAAFAFLAGRWIRNPHLAHGLWLLVLVKLVTPPVYVLETAWFRESQSFTDHKASSTEREASPILVGSIEPANDDAEVFSPLPAETHFEDVLAEPPISADPINAEPQPSPTAIKIGWLQALLLVWIIGAILCGGLVISRSSRFRRLLALATPAEESLKAEALRLSERMGLERSPAIDLIDAQIPPLVWGMFGRPRILLPQKLMGGLSLEQRRTVLAHELAHIRRKDHLVRWIEVCVLVLFWWYPIAWWASRELRRAEEECCDALVIWALPESRQTYALALCQTIDFLVEAPLPIPKLAGGTLGSPPLKRRIEMIMKQNVHHKMSWKAWSAMLLVAAIALPVVAQNSASEKPRSSDEPTTDAPKESSNLTGEDEEIRPSNSKPQEPGDDPNGQSLPQNLPDTLQGATQSSHADLKPSSDLRISSLHSGTIVNVLVAEGDLVKKDQILMEIQNTEMEIRHQEVLGELNVGQEKIKTADLAIRQAAATLELAKAEYERVEKLGEKGAISQSEARLKKSVLETAQLKLQQAELEERALELEFSALQKRAELAARLVKELVIKAPADGVVLELEAKAGELVKANDAVARIVRLSPLMAESYVSDPEGLLGQMVVVLVSLSKDKTHKFPAKITFVSPIADPASGAVRIRCLFKNAGPDGQPLVRPGQRAFVILPVNRDEAKTIKN